MTHHESTDRPNELGELIRGFRKADFPDHESMKAAIERGLTETWTRLCVQVGLLDQAGGDAPQVAIDMNRGNAVRTHVTGYAGNLAVRVRMKVSLGRWFDMILIRVTGGHRSAIDRVEPLAGKRSMNSREAPLPTLARLIRELVDEVGGTA
ncbi:MAG: hypothetical protein ACOC71_03180 [Hyphomicrobiales bacterium]